MKNISKDYLIILFPLIILIALAWGYLLMMANSMDMDSMQMDMSQGSTDMNMDSMQMDMSQGSTDMNMDSMNLVNQFNLFAMPMSNQWSTNDFVVMTIMWVVMMFAMMVPSTLIFLQIFHAMRSNMSTVKHPKLELTILIFTYFLIWTLFSLVACFLQFILHNQDLVNNMGMITSNLLAGITLVAAGFFQFSALKDKCLEKCRNPLSFIMGKKINGLGDIFKIGLQHGLFCLACCWALMMVLFINGVMNLLWVVIITFVVLAEKIIPFHQLTSRFFGILLVLWGTFLIFF